MKILATPDSSPSIAAAARKVYLGLFLLLHSLKFQQGKGEEPSIFYAPNALFEKQSDKYV
jgi:hypothetical protein